MNAIKARGSRVRRSGRAAGFTLIELLTVIAIITLLIGILVPSLSRARDQAKNASIRAKLKAIGDGLEMFRNENEAELPGGRFPPSAPAEDPTEDGQQDIFGAQWLVRYLLGKDFNGYISVRNVPPALRERRTTNPENWQKDWYTDIPTSNNPYAPLPRNGPYLNQEGVKIVRAAELPNQPSAGLGVFNVDSRTYEQPVILDDYGYPILYYAANTVQYVTGPTGQKIFTPIATYDARPPNAVPGTFNFSDNALFTGRCIGGACDVPPWDFEGIGGVNPHNLGKFGQHTNNVPSRDTIDNPTENIDTFPYIIMNKQAFQSTDRKTVVPFRKDSFLLFSAGKDGAYGTHDDVNNFDTGN